MSIIALALGLILGATALFQSGWRVGPDGITRTVRGKVCLVAPLTASVLYVDEKQVGTSRVNDGELCESLAAGEHTLLLATPGSWPWIKKITVTAATPTHRYRAFTLAQNITKTTLDPGTKEYILAQNALVTSLVPSPSSPLRSADGTRALWYEPEARVLVAEWRGEKRALPRAFCEEDVCVNMITLLANVVEPPRALAFAPGRDDVVLIAAGIGIYALEITATQERNFQPVYSGTAPTLVPNDAASIYVGDGSTLFKIALDAGL